MTTSAFLAALRANAGLPLVFVSHDQPIAPDYHLTEVKAVTYRSMDCGSATHAWHENHFELAGSAIAEADHRDPMPAAKFLRITERVQRTLAVAGEHPARIFATIGDHPPALYDIAGIAAEDGRLVVRLRDDRVQCKASARAAAGQGCGCGQPASSRATATACCV